MRKQRAFATLTEEEINQIAGWLRHEKYEEVRQRVNKPRPEGFGLKISVGPLQTLYRKTNIVAKINSHFSGPSSEHLTVTKLDAILIGDQPASEKAHSAIMEATYEMATSGENTVTQLLGLQRLADFPARLEIREQRLELDHQKFEHKLDMDTFRKDMTQKRFDFAQETFAFRQQVHQDRLTLAEAKRNPHPAPQPQSDQQGLFARTREDVSERVRIRIGISKEEAERLRALRQAHREEQARLAAQQPQPEFTGTGGARSTAPETSPLPPEPAHGVDEPTRPCNADFQSAVLPNITPNLNPNPNPNPVNTSPIPSGALSVAAVCDRRSVCSPLPNENCSMPDARSNSPASTPSAPSASIPNFVKPANPVQSSSLNLVDFLNDLTSELAPPCPIPNENCSSVQIPKA